MFCLLMKQMKLDTHVHCLEASRCARLQPEEAVQCLRAAGYDAFVLTNHCFPEQLQYFGPDLRAQLDGYLGTYEKAQKAGKENGIRVLFGCELRLIREPHAPEFLLFGMTVREFAETFPLYNLSQKELFAYCNRQNILMYQAHPFRMEQGHRPADLSRMHGIEVYNGHPGFAPRMWQAKAFADSAGLAYSAGSDFHMAIQAGNAAMLVDASIETSEDLRDCLKREQPPLCNREGVISF